MNIQEIMLTIAIVAIVLFYTIPNWSYLKYTFLSFLEKHFGKK